MGSLLELPRTQQKHIELSLITRGQLRLVSDILEKWTLAEGWHPKYHPRRLNSESHRHLGFLEELLSTNLNPVPYRSLFRIVLGRFHGNVAILENPYLEMEFWDTYSFFHSRSFLGRRKQCWRLHFFRYNKRRRGTRSADIVSLLRSGATQPQLAKGGFKYLGFATFRPVRSYSLGRTAVLFDTAPGSRAKEGDDPLEATGRSFCKGKAEQPANVCSTKLRVNTVPFLQQDPVAGMCVAASLWITSQVLASRFDLHKYPYIDISRQATLTTGTSPSPSTSDLAQDFARGLSPVETCAALTKTGALPLFILPKPFRGNACARRARIKNQIYSSLSRSCR